MNCIPAKYAFTFFSLWNDVFLLYVLQCKFGEYLIFTPGTISEINVRNDCSQILIWSPMSEEIVRDFIYLLLDLFWVSL